MANNPRYSQLEGQDQPFTWERNYIPGPLEYVEGTLLTATELSENKTGTRACWLADSDDKAVCVVSEDADFERSKIMLRHAAYATQILPQETQRADRAEARIAQLERSIGEMTDAWGKDQAQVVALETFWGELLDGLLEFDKPLNRKSIGVVLTPRNQMALLAMLRRTK